MIVNIFTCNAVVLHGEVGPLDALEGVNDVLEAKARWLVVVLLGGKFLMFLKPKLALALVADD